MRFRRYLRWIGWVTLTIALSPTGSAETQLARFFSGLKTAQNATERQAWIGESKPSPDALVLKEELPALLEALRDNDASLNYVAAQYFAYLAGSSAHQPNARQFFEDALPAMAAHFDDPVPGPNLNLIRNGYHGSAGGWPGLVFAYLEFSGLTLPPNLIASAIRALDGPDSAGAIEQLSKLQPPPPEVLRALIAKFRAGDTAAKTNVIIHLHLARVKDPQFVDIVTDALYSPDRDLRGAAVSAARNLGAAMRSALPVLQKIADTHPFNDETKAAARMIVNDLLMGTATARVATYQANVEAKDPAEIKGADPESMRLAAYLAFLKSAEPEQRRTLLARDVRQMPLARTLVPEEDVPLLIELLHGDDPDLAASAASHLVLMAFQNIAAGTKTRQLIATALPALAAHYDDPLPPVTIGADKQPTAQPTLWQAQVMTFIWIAGTTPPPPLVPKIVAALQDDGMAMWATQALARLKPMPDEVLAAVLEKVRTAGWEVRNSMIGALVENGINHPMFVQALAANLESSDGHHLNAAAALSRLGPAARPAEAALRKFLSKEAVPGTEEAGAQVYARMALRNLSAK